MKLQDLLNAEATPTAEAVNTAIFGFLGELAAKFEKRDEENPWRNSPKACLRRMTLQMAELAHDDDDIAHLIKAFRLGQNGLVRAAYGIDASYELDDAADSIEAMAESICNELRVEATDCAA